MQIKFTKYILDTANKKFKKMDTELDRGQVKKLNHVLSGVSKSRKHITIRVINEDLEALKIKASKLGIPYQTYINMLIHTDVKKKD